LIVLDFAGKFLAAAGSGFYLVIKFYPAASRRHLLYNFQVKT
jgi:hypothetical protein